MNLNSPAVARSLQLIFISAAVLYLELAFIRFTSAEVLYLGYFSNFVLLSVFVGLGLGFLSAKKARDKTYQLSIFCGLFIFLFALVLLSHFDTNFLMDRDGIFFFGNSLGGGGLPGWLLLIILFLVVATLFLYLGQSLGELFIHFSPLRAYALDISGSLFGILLFSIQSFLWSGPVIWVVTGVFLLVVGILITPDNKEEAKKSALLICLSGLCVVLLLMASMKSNVSLWSPYQKLEARMANHQGVNRVEIYANGIFHQIITNPERASHSYYGLPYSVHSAAGGSLEDVLIVGAGSGTDLSVALLQPNVKSVDAVEIDPGIVELGINYNKAEPYSDPRVHRQITDGRAFLKRAGKKYDLIIFALPDSLMRISSLSNVRLESYLFTLESFQEVKNLLKPNGSFFLYNQYRWDWLKNKISEMLETVFGKPPQRIEFNETTILGSGSNLAPTMYSKEGYTQLATDDWPNVYMQEPQVAWFYMAMIFVFLLVAFSGVHFLAPKGTLQRPDLPFFFMGAAFLLLEAKSISLFSLLFGTTWLVNSFVFAGILVSVLLANVIVSKWKIKRTRFLFAGLAISILLAYLIRPSNLLEVGNIPLRYVVAILLYFSPIFFANLIFSREFRDFKDSQTAFGWNLLGAVMGGGLEYFGLVIGSRNLLWLVLIFYGFAALSLRRKKLVSA